MRYDVHCQKCRKEFEIIKAMTADMPRCRQCGGVLKRLYRIAPPVQFNSDGFTLNETRFKHQIGSERYARFEAQKRAAERRAARGQLTTYEQTLETI